MGRLMHDAYGIGLAATQVGVMHRLLVYRTELEGSVAALVNPVLEWSSKDKETSEEGCLSLPGVERRGRAAGPRPRPRAGRARQADPGRGERPRGARDPARDGPPGRRPDPRPHLARPAQAGHARAARGARPAAHRPPPSSLAQRLPRHLGVRGGRPAGAGRVRAHRPQLVVTRPDAKQGRGQKLAPPPVAVLARELGIDVIQPEDLHAPEVLEQIADGAAEVLTTCAYGVLIKEPLLSDYEMLNVHPSLLPRWRGAAPIERAIMAGDAETGVTIMRVTAGWDSGPIYLAGDGADPPRRRLRHARAAAGDARRAAARPGARRAPDARSSRTSRSSPTRTRSARASARWTRRSRPRQVERTVRALRPHIGSRLPLPDGSFLGVIAAEVDGPTRAPAGGLVRAEGDRLLLDCHGGALELTEVRPPGGRPMAAVRLAARPPGPGRSPASATTRRCRTAT